MSWQFSEDTQNAIFTFAGSVNARQLQYEDPERSWLCGRCDGAAEFFWNIANLSEPEFTAYDVHIGAIASGDVTWDEPPMRTFSATLHIRTDDGIETLTYQWQEEDTWPNTTWGKTIGFSATITVPMKITAEMAVIDALTGTKIWKDYPTAKSAGWMADPELRLSWERDETQDITVHADIMGVTGDYVANTLYVPDMFGAVACRLHTSASVHPSGDDWDDIASYTLATGGCLEPLSFGTHEYTLDGYPVLSLSGTSVSVSASSAGLAEGPAICSYVSAYNSTYSGNVRYLEGGEFTDPPAQVTIEEEAPVWDPGSLVWEQPHGGTTVFEATGGVIEYEGWWELTGIYGYSGDYIATAGTASCKSTGVTLVNGEYVSRHGPLAVVTPGDIEQPAYAATADPDDESFADCRMLCTLDEPGTVVTDILEITPTHSSRQVVEWLYTGLSDWTYDPDKLTLANVDGQIQVTCVSADGTMSIAYADCRKEAGADTDNWLGVRFFEVGISGTDTTDFNIEIAGRTYAVSTDKQRVDVLACAEALPDPPTQSALPTFQPALTTPPTVTDVPKDWGIYQPGTITLSGFTEGKTYLLDGITLVRTSAPKFVVVPEAQWVGYESNCDRDPSVDGDPAAFHQAATTVWAHRTGVVMLDGMILAEIVSTLFDSDGGWSETYPSLAHTRDYFAYPHPVTALVTVSVEAGATRTFGMEYEWDAGGDQTQIPLGYLLGYQAGPVVTTDSIDAQLQFCRLSMPPNMLRQTVYYDKRYGGLGVVRIADATRNWQVRAVDVTTGCTGNYSATTGLDGVFLTWGTSEECKALSQYAVHEWSVTVTDGDEGSASHDVRNRALSILTIQSDSPPLDPGEEPPYVPQITERLWQPDSLGQFLHPMHPLGV